MAELETKKGAEPPAEQGPSPSLAGGAAAPADRRGTRSLQSWGRGRPEGRGYRDPQPVAPLPGAGRHPRRDPPQQHHHDRSDRGREDGDRSSAGAARRRAVSSRWRRRSSPRWVTSDATWSPWCADLVDSAINMVRGEREDDIYPQAEARAEERLLDLLLPSPSAQGGATGARRGSWTAAGGSATRGCRPAAGVAHPVRGLSQGRR